MTNNHPIPPNRHHGPTDKRASSLPEWLALLQRIAEPLASPILIISGLLFLVIMLLTLGGAGVRLAWYPQLFPYFGFFVVLGFLLLCLRYLHKPDAAIIAIVTGLGLFFSPYGIAYLIAEQYIRPSDVSIVTYSEPMAQIGVTLSLLAVLFLMAHYLCWFGQRRQQRLRSMIVRSGNVEFNILDSPMRDVTDHRGSTYEPPSYIPKCWEMSRCRKQVRVICPNYIDHVNCWQRRCGCLCDREFATFLINIYGTPETQIAIKSDRIAAIPGIATMRERLKRFQQERKWAAHKKLCVSCAVFLEHQEYKYRHLNWIGFPVTLAIAAALFPLYHEGYEVVAGQLDYWAQQLFLVVKLPDNFHPQASTLVDSPFEYVFLFVLIILLASFVFDFTDRCLLKWNL